MPIFEDIEITANISFEVFCRTCGLGLCNESEAISNHNPHINVNACPNCIEEARQEIRSDLENQIQELQNRLTLLGE